MCSTPFRSFPTLAFETFPQMHTDEFVIKYTQYDDDDVVFIHSVVTPWYCSMLRRV